MTEEPREPATNMERDDATLSHEERRDAILARMMREDRELLDRLAET